MYSLGYINPVQYGGSLIDTARRIAEAEGMDLGRLQFMNGNGALGPNGGTTWGGGGGTPAPYKPPPPPPPAPVTLAPIEVEVSKAGIPGGLLFGLAILGMFAARALR